MEEEIEENDEVICGMKMVERVLNSEDIKSLFYAAGSLSLSLSLSLSHPNSVD